MRKMKAVAGPGIGYQKTRICRVRLNLLAQAADVIIGIPTFLFGFISNVFVDPANMPPWLRVFANWNPISALVTAGRQLFGNSIGPPPPGVWSLDHPVVTTIGLAILIVAIAAPFCVRRFSRISH